MRLFAVFAIVIAATTFAVQNAPAVTVNLFPWRFDAPLALVITACFAAGALVSLLASVPHLYRLYRMRAHERLLRAQAADMETEETRHARTRHQHGGSQAPLAHWRMSSNSTAAWHLRRSVNTSSPDRWGRFVSESTSQGFTVSGGPNP